MTYRRFLLPVSLAAFVPLAFALSSLTANAQTANTRTFGALGKEVMNFIYYEKAIMPNDNDMTIDDDALTTQRVCQLAGYSTVQSVTKRYFASCGDNRILSWNGSAWQISPACSRDGFISTLVCSNPIASSSSSSFSSSFSFPSNSSNSSSTSSSGGFSAIDVKINGQDGTVNAPLGSQVVISWTSNGVQRCDTDGSESPWGPNRSVATNGSETVTVTKSMTFSIQCAQTPTSPMIVMDVVGVNATAGGTSSSSSFSSFSSAPASSAASSLASVQPSSSSSSLSSSNVSNGTTGCIQVYKQAYDMNGNEYPVTPQFAFMLDGNTQTTFNGSNGLARFDNVQPGNHVVTESVPTNWRQLLVTPENGVVSVFAGRCTGIVFINRQMFPSGSSSSNSSSSNSSSSSLSSNSSISSSSSVSSSVSSSASSANNTSSVSSASSSASSLSSVSSVSSVSSSSLSSSASSLSSASSVNSSSFSSSSSSSSVNLTISKTDNRTTVNRGERIAYTISISNNTSVTATNVTVTDDLPSMVTFSSASDGGTLNGSRVTWTNLTVPANSTFFLTVTVDVKSDASGTLVNNATVNGNVATDTSVVNTPAQTALQLTKFASYQQIGSNRTIDYTVRVSNAGSVSATNLVVTDTLSPSVTITDTGGGTQNGNQLQWNVGTLAAGDSRTFQYRVSVNAGVGGGTAINNTVRATASNASTVEVTLTMTTLAQAQAVQFAQSSLPDALNGRMVASSAQNRPESSFSGFLIGFLRFLSPVSVIQAIAASI